MPPPHSSKAVSWGIYISQKLPKCCFCVWARHLPKGCWKQILLGRYHPRVFNERFAKQIPPEEKVDATTPWFLKEYVLKCKQNRLHIFCGDISRNNSSNILFDLGEVSHKVLPTIIFPPLTDNLITRATKLPGRQERWLKQRPDDVGTSFAVAGAIVVLLARPCSRQILHLLTSVGHFSCLGQYLVTSHYMTPHRTT